MVTLLTGVFIYACMISLSIHTNVALAGLSDGLVAYYPFNGNVNDESGNGNNGTVYGATLTTDRLGNANSAYSFDGVDDYVSIPPLYVKNDLTISFWLNTTSSDSNGWSWAEFIIDRDICNLQRDWSVRVRNNAPVRHQEVRLYR